MSVRAVVMVVSLKVARVLDVFRMPVLVRMRVCVGIVAGMKWPVHAPASLLGLCGAAP